MKGSRPRPSSSIRAPSTRRDSITGAMGRLRACGSPSKDTRPDTSAATGGRNRITVPASPQSTEESPRSVAGLDQPVRRLGVVAVDVLDHRAQRAQRLRHQERVAGPERPPQPGACRWPARRGRGTGWSATCCPEGRRRPSPARGRGERASRRSPWQVVRPSGGAVRARRSGERVVGVRRDQARLAARAPGGVTRHLLGLALAERGRAAGVLGGPLGAPGQARLAGRVDRGQQQAAEQPEVLQEVLALRGALGRVVLLPEGVPRVGRGRQGGGKDRARTAGGDVPAPACCPRRPWPRRWPGRAARGRPEGAAARPARGSPAPQPRPGLRGWRSESMPPWMKTAASIGRARRRTTVIGSPSQRPDRSYRSCSPRPPRL